MAAASVQIYISVKWSVYTAYAKTTKKLSIYKSILNNKIVILICHFVHIQWVIFKIEIDS